MSAGRLSARYRAWTESLVVRVFEPFGRLIDQVEARNRAAPDRPNRRLRAPAGRPNHPHKTPSPGRADHRTSPTSKISTRCGWLKRRSARLPGAGVGRERRIGGELHVKKLERRRAVEASGAWRDRLGPDDRSRAASQCDSCRASGRTCPSRGAASNCGADRYLARASIIPTGDTRRKRRAWRQTAVVDAKIGVTIRKADVCMGHGKDASLTNELGEIRAWLEEFPPPFAP